MPAKLYIKNMVCPRCIKVVREELDGLGHRVETVELGEVTLGADPRPEQLAKIRRKLEENGFALIEDASKRIIEKVKHAVLKLVRTEREAMPRALKDSAFIALEVGMEYHKLSSLFSSVENITIEQYCILQRVERVKELLKYGETTLTEISYAMGYSSVGHLSSQFKKVTGMTPTAFRRMTLNLRRPIDTIAR
jgi:AraC family transcriptional regulator